MLRWVRQSGMISLVMGKELEMGECKLWKGINGGEEELHEE